MNAGPLTSRQVARSLAMCLLTIGASLSCRSRPVPPAQQTRPTLTGSAELCAPGEVRCEGAALQRCADDGSTFVTLETCSSAILCQTDPAGCSSAGCLVDEMTCRGPELLVCNKDRTRFDLFDTCESDSHCSASERRCLPEPCAADALRCNRTDEGTTVLERCDPSLAGWGSVDTCTTRQLCDQTLSNTNNGDVIRIANGQIQVRSGDTEVETCLAAACQAEEWHCEGATLLRCNEGLTRFNRIDECGSAALCQQSLAEAIRAASALCVIGACEPGSFRCTPAGALEVCAEDRTGYRLMQQCIGAAFCDAAQGACTDAPCEPGLEQCNANQPQRCREDQSAYEPIGDPCLSAALCNDEESSAFCEEAACARGALSSNEYLCNGVELTRCREDRTGYDTLETCATPELCDPAAGQCRLPACVEGEHNCEGGLLQRCNAGRTGFADVETCGDASQCDATSGTCTDPCEPGTARCTPQGEIEECRDRLTGWRVTADCITPELCDESGPTCLPPVCQPNTSRCRPQGQSTVVERCAEGRDQYDLIKTCEPDEICDFQAEQCDVCDAGSIRCEGDTLVTCSADGQQESRQTCGSGLCSADAGRCLACDPIGSARCQSRQLVVCSQGNQGEFERSEDCDTPELCQDTLADCGGENCQCNDGICLPGEARCNGNQLVQCNAGRNGFNALANCGPGLCNARAQRCDECSGNGSACLDGDRRQFCQDGLFAQQTCPGAQICNQNTGQCFTPECAPGGRNCFGNALQACSDDRTAFDFIQNCPPGLCNAAAGRCDECSGNSAICIGDNLLQVCQGGLLQTQTCSNGQICRNNQCQFPACNQGAFNCFGNALQRCNSDRTAFDFVQNCPQGLCNAGAGRCDQCSGNASSCINGNVREFCQGGLLQRQNCPNGQTCTGNQCQQQVCSPNQRSCSNTLLQQCNAAGTAQTTIAVCPSGCNSQRLECNQCTPGSRQNVCANAATLRQCTADGRFIDIPCGPNADCQGGQCVPRCTPGTTNGCISSTTIRFCNDAGQLVPMPCFPGSTCTDGRCAQDQICTPNEPLRCDGSVPIRCNATGTFEVRGTACGEGRFCFGGTCGFLPR